MHYLPLSLLTLLSSTIAFPSHDLSARAEAAWSKTHTIAAPRCELGPNEFQGEVAGGCSGGYTDGEKNYFCSCDRTESGLSYCLDSAIMPYQNCKKDSECPQGGACSYTLGIALNEGGGICSYSKTCTSTYGVKPAPVPHKVAAPRCRLGPKEAIGTPFGGGCKGSFTIDGIAHDCVCDISTSGMSYCVNEAFPYPNKSCKSDNDCSEGAICDVNLGYICVRSSGCTSTYVP